MNRDLLSIGIRVFPLSVVLALAACSGASPAPAESFGVAVGSLPGGAKCNSSDQCAEGVECCAVTLEPDAANPLATDQSYTGTCMNPYKATIQLQDGCL